jgi:hypothetical protein
LINTPDVCTFYRQNTRPLVIDLAFVIAEMYEEVRNWEIPHELQIGAEHVLIRFGVITRFTELVENPLYSGPYNLEKANWDRFRNLLRRNAITVLDLYYTCDNWNNESLDLLVNEIQHYIQQAADELIPRKRQLTRSKPW